MNGRAVRSGATAFEADGRGELDGCGLKLELVLAIVDELGDGASDEEGDWLVPHPPRAIDDTTASEHSSAPRLAHPSRRWPLITRQPTTCP